MAIGDTIQAGLMRTDSSPIQIAGAAQARANQAFGNALTSVATGFLEGREKKARAEEMAGYLMNQGASESDAKAIARNPFLQKEFQRKQEADQRMEIAKLQASTSSSNVSRTLASKAKEMEVAEDLSKKKEAKLAEQEQKNIDFSKFIVSGTEMDPKVLDDFNQVQPGLPALGGNQTRRNQFLEYTRDKAPKVGKLGGELDSSEFASKAMEAGVDPLLVGSYYMKLQKEEAEARQKDAPSISRLVTVQDGKGGFEQVGVDSAGNPIKSFGPPKPSGMFATPDQQADARAKTLSVDNANDFVNTQRNSALDSAKSIRPATRALTLLEKGDLETGGISELKTNAIAMLDSLGIPIDKETMDRVSNTQNFRAEVGKFLFENISNTKGSISQKEMDIFAKISPGLQMTPEANKTLLNYVIKKAERDKDKVKFIQKMRRDGVSITEQRNKLEDYMLDNDLSEILSPIAGEPTEQQPFRSPQGDVNGKVVGTKPNGDKLIDVNGQIFVQPAQ
jgi:hypothetical protein